MLDNDTHDNPSSVGVIDMSLRDAPFNAWCGGSSSKTKETTYVDSSQFIGVLKDSKTGLVMNETDRLEEIILNWPPVRPNKVVSYLMV